MQKSKAIIASKLSIIMPVSNRSYLPKPCVHSRLLVVLKRMQQTTFPPRKPFLSSVLPLLKPYVLLLIPTSASACIRSELLLRLRLDDCALLIQSRGGAVGSVVGLWRKAVSRLLLISLTGPTS